jgi:hypothetical protein
MKKLILAALALSVILPASVAHGQELKKGTLVGVHTFDVQLAPGASIEQFVDCSTSRVLPALNSNLQGWKFYPVKWVRGEKSGKYGYIVVVPEKERDRHYNPDGSQTEVGKAVAKKLQPLYDECAKLGTLTDKYIDWVIQ